MILDAANAVMVQFNFDAGNLAGYPTSQALRLILFFED
jgi:hypothetical protein